MLNTKLAEERRNEKPDVTQMVRRLNILKFLITHVFFEMFQLKININLFETSIYPEK